MSMLFTFAGLSMCVSAVCTLLPGGSLKKTASLVLSLTLLVFWLDTVSSSWSLPELAELPVTVLSGTDAADIDDIQLHYIKQWSDNAAR